MTDEHALWEAHSAICELLAYRTDQAQDGNARHRQLVKDLEEVEQKIYSMWQEEYLNHDKRGTTSDTTAA